MFLPNENETKNTELWTPFVVTISWLQGLLSPRFLGCWLPRSPCLGRNLVSMIPPCYSVQALVADVLIGVPPASSSSFLCLPVRSKSRNSQVRQYENTNCTWKVVLQFTIYGHDKSHSTSYNNHCEKQFWKVLSLEVTSDSWSFFQLGHTFYLEFFVIWTEYSVTVGHNWNNINIYLRCKHKRTMIYKTRNALLC